MLQKKEQEASLAGGGVMQPSAMAKLGAVTKLGAEGALCHDCRGLADAGGRPELSSRVRLMDSCWHRLTLALSS